MIRGHGDDLYRYEGIEGNFSSNVYTHTDNEALLTYLQNCLLSDVASYPEPEPYSLQAMLAEYHHIDKDCVLVTNGATEAIYLIAHLFAGQEIAIAEPTFSEYRSASELFGCITRHNSSVRWLCNPNNPTGKVQSESGEKEDILIIDRSYEYFCRHSLPPLQWDNRHIYIYSLTKRYRIPGLRLGYILSSPELIARLKALRQPWSVNALAIDAGKWIVRHDFPESIDRPTLWQECDRLQAALRAIPHIEVFPTDTHFFLIKTALPANELKELLATKYKLLLRDASNFEGLSPYHLRIATQSRAMNDRLIEVLTDIMSTL